MPLWGYLDESDPKVMAQKIAAAADHGIDAFIFDWYYYDDGPFLDRPIDIGFLQATNNHRLKFAFMWANHDWLEIQPSKQLSYPLCCQRPEAGDLHLLRRLPPTSSAGQTLTSSRHRQFAAGEWASSERARRGRSPSAREKPPAAARLRASPAS